MKTLKLEVGKTYRSREGKEVKIVRKNDKDRCPCYGNNGEWYTESGRWWGRFGFEGPEGLIEEVTDPILQFFTPTRTELFSISAIESAAGIPPRTLYKFLKGTRGLPKKHREPLIEILKQVGYEPSCVDKDELISDLDDRRAVGVKMNEDMWYFCRKQSAEYLLDKYKLLRK